MPAASRGIGVTLLAALFALLATPVAAHTDLVSSRPADGAVLDAAPPAVSARFGEDLLPAGARLVAEDASGAAVDHSQSYFLPGTFRLHVVRRPARRG